MDNLSPEEFVKKCFKMMLIPDSDNMVELNVILDREIQNSGWSCNLYKMTEEWLTNVIVEILKAYVKQQKQIEETNMNAKALRDRDWIKEINKKKKMCLEVMAYYDELQTQVHKLTDYQIKSKIIDITTEL